MRAVTSRWQSQPAMTPTGTSQDDKCCPQKSRLQPRVSAELTSWAPWGVDNEKHRRREEECLAASTGDQQDGWLR